MAKISRCFTRTKIMKDPACHQLAVATIAIFMLISDLGCKSDWPKLLEPSQQFLHPWCFQAWHSLTVRSQSHKQSCSDVQVCNGSVHLQFLSASASSGLEPFALARGPLLSAQQRTPNRLTPAKQAHHLIPSQSPAGKPSPMRSLQKAERTTNLRLRAREDTA